jgi:hypothetical protein
MARLADVQGVGAPIFRARPGQAKNLAINRRHIGGMNAILPIVESCAPKWSEINTAINVWRGASLQCFAEAEKAVTETLLALKAVEGRGQGVEIEHLVGQKLAALAKAINVDGPFAKEGKKAAKALASFREFDDLRKQLCHGMCTPATQQNNEWLVVIRQLVVRGGDADLVIGVVTQAELADRLKTLKRRAQTLRDVLRNLRMKLEVPEAPKPVP